MKKERIKRIQCEHCKQDDTKMFWAWIPRYEAALLGLVDGEVHRGASTPIPEDATQERLMPHARFVCLVCGHEWPIPEWIELPKANPKEADNMDGDWGAFDQVNERHKCPEVDYALAAGAPSMPTTDAIQARIDEYLSTFPEAHERDLRWIQEEVKACMLLNKKVMSNQELDNELQAIVEGFTRPFDYQMLYGEVGPSALMGTFTQPPAGLPMPSVPPPPQKVIYGRSEDRHHTEKVSDGQYVGFLDDPRPGGIGEDVSPVQVRPAVQAIQAAVAAEVYRAAICYRLDANGDLHPAFKD